MSAQNGHSSYKIILDGETVAKVGDDLSPASQQGYTGHVGDNTGLVYMQARYYDPVIGRFYSNDPVGAIAHLGTANGIHGFNRYAYANNNPFKFVDPDGRSSVDLESLFNPLKNLIPDELVNKEITTKNIEQVPKRLANDLGGKKMLETQVQVNGSIPTPPTQAVAFLSATLLATVYDDPSAVVATAVGKGAGKYISRKGASDTVAVITEETASRVAEEATKLIIEEDRLE
ncbi:RHS repeat-associated protein [Idiomarina fontislapidosi]|uniref:RHS repeat-associated core domain-containing protein n=1 Tax=Idiomarina fontislapidosi TaxID=263723 RepID=UPI000D9B3BCD|nr:RHS repeat-associated core domain-containing protein [Idiomarina fontislapidosi]PYE30040.1 RHS repeat-associated protein [Idiomarina fontislapidosi]